MDFLKRNSGKIALLAIIAFFTLPFIYGNEEEEDFSPFAVKSGMSYQANPISKLANKIASFYGFSRPASQMTASSNGTDSIKDKVSFNKENPFGIPDSKKSQNLQNNTLVASSKNFKNFDTNFSDSNSPNPQKYNGRNNSLNNSYDNNNPVKGYVTINGQNYSVIEDAQGNKYVVTPRGHIPYKEVMRRTVSDKEFMDAKKRLAGASDMEVLAVLQKEKEKQALASKQNYQASAAGYRNGTASNMGGTNYARVSTDDTGLDDNVLSSAYADLKNIDLRKGGAFSSGSGNSQSSFSGTSAKGNNYLNTNSSNQGSARTENALVPGGIAQTVQEQVVSRTSKAGNSQVRTGQEDLDTAREIGKPSEGTVTGTEAGMPAQAMSNGISRNNIIRVQKTKGDNSDTAVDTYKIVNDDSAPIFIAGNSVWGEPTAIMIDDKEQIGVVVPINYQKGKIVLTGDEVDSTIETNVKSMNNSLKEIRQKMESLDENTTIFIDDSGSDSVSSEIMRDVVGSYIKNQNNIVNNKDDATVILTAPIFTPFSFDKSAEDFVRQVDQILQAGNEPA